MSTYVNLTQNEFDLIIKALKLNKNQDLVNSLYFQYNKIKNSNPSYKLAASNLLSKLDSKMHEQDELIVDDDAIVSENENGAYVQCWVWVNSQTKQKKVKKGLK